MKGITRFNEMLAVWVTEKLGTMGCTYAFIVLCIAPLVLPAQQNNILYLSNCCQLVFLPLLMVSNIVQGRKAERRAAADHKAIMDSHRIIHAEVQRLKEIEDSIMSLACKKLAENNHG